MRDGIVAMLSKVLPIRHAIRARPGTLTQNKTTAVAATLGITSQFGSEFLRQQDCGSTSMGSASFVDTLVPAARKLVLDSIALNSTAFEGEEAGVLSVIGSKNETALLIFARDSLGMSSVGEERANAKIVDMLLFESGRKYMAVVRIS
ncbi:plasma membrane calcium [Rhinocladiella similis]